MVILVHMIGLQVILSQLVLPLKWIIAF